MQLERSLLRTLSSLLLGLNPRFRGAGMDRGSNPEIVWPIPTISEDRPLAVDYHTPWSFITAWMVTLSFPMVLLAETFISRRK